MTDDVTRKTGRAVAASGGAGWRAVELATVTTTQSEAAARAATGERGPLWVRADVQTEGRGRSGRNWATPSGNFAATLILTPRCEVALLPQLSLVAGVAVADALNGFIEDGRTLGSSGRASQAGVSGSDGAGATATRAVLKWPNDLLIGTGKVGGILVETSVSGREALALIGIGINLAVAPDVPGRSITRLADHMIEPPSPSQILQSVATNMHHWLAIWDQGLGFSAIRAAWLARALALGAPISVNAGEGPVEGTFAGLDMDGSLLLLEPTGRERSFSWGDVTLAPAKV